MSPMEPARPVIDKSSLLPYIVTHAYPADPALTRPLGHGLSIALVIGGEGIVSGATAQDLENAGLSIDEAMHAAHENLGELRFSGKIDAYKFPLDDRAFILFGPHWATASFILHEELRHIGMRELGTGELCVSIPHRAALLLFPKGDRKWRSNMQSLIYEREAGAPKLLTFGLFELNASGVREMAG